MSHAESSAQGRDRVAARVFACLTPGEIRLILHPGVGLADGGIPVDVPIHKVPFELRMPNTEIWVRLDESWRVQEVWRRIDD